uniref:RNA-directed DNA polymerase, eukaryota n=1 Tax=Tanacetum cinerariifolium TaxID=118510 RepID=A0A6L2KTI1_TANCI|nr:RNA-directed DNA polymerase, eukaryota [Tanacetum cinerariifolium]
MAASFLRSSHLTNEDRTQKISHSVYVTNFPDSITSRDLWKTCSAYGTVVDVFIPLKKSKACKRFAFVHFIKVNNLVRLVDNLCTIWIGRYHLYANQVRFERPHKPNLIPNTKYGVLSRSFNPSVLQQSNGRVGSYVNIVNGVSLGMHGSSISPSPTLVLDDTCLVEHDLTKNAMGKTLDLEDNADTSFGRKRLCVKTKHFVSILETFKIIVKGRVFMVRAKELFTWNPTFVAYKERDYSSEDESVHASKNNEFSPHPNEEESGDDYASDDDGVPKTVFGSNSSSHKHDNRDKEDTHSEDPFGFYDLLKNKKRGDNRESSPYLSHPPGFTPEVSEKRDENVTDIGGTDSNVIKEAPVVFSAKTKKEWIKALTNSYKLNFLAIQETKMPRVSHMDVKFLWGNSNYNYVCSDSLGSSGGILCMWEALIFKKDNVTTSNNFIAIYGTWLPSNSKILFVVIYAPQHASYKRNLWDYISTILGRWNGEAIIMGDFNEVRSSDERRGSCFNPYSARHFDRFIFNSGLVDVTLEGYAFTWSHPSASKMSKLDRFLVSDGIFSLFPSITALCLDRHLSDHQPILLREVHLDFGPTPFRKKLQDLKIIIRRWVKVKRLELSGSKNDIVTELGEIDKVMDRGEVDDVTVLRQLVLKHKLLNVTEMEAKDRFQKSKVKWAVEGDENSKFFHARFKEPVAHRFKLNFQFHKKLLQSQADDLERGVSRDEIRRAVWNCGDNKSPGLDGYTFEFFKKYWDLVGSDFCDAIEFFLRMVHFPKDMFLRPLGLGKLAVIGFEELSAPLRRLSCWTVDEGLFKGIQLPGSISISHLFYADDAMFIEEWSDGNLKGVMVEECSSRLKAWDDIILKIRSRLSNRFFNGADQSDKKITWVASDKVLASKKHGGLGVSSFFALNRAFLLKCVWRFVSQDGSLWCQVIQALYGSSVGSHPTHLSSNWCSMVRELHKLKGKGFDFWSHCKKRIGNGNDMRFWSDCWNGDMPLCAKFPRLFALELDKKASVAVKLSAPVDNSFCRSARGGLEQHLMAVMNSMLDPVSLSNSCDRWFCDLASDGDFQLRRFDCLPTRVNLVRRGVNIESSVCLISKAGPRSKSGSPGSYRSGSHPRLNLYWRVFSLLLGGLFGGLGIVPLLRKIILDVQRFLMT